MSTADQLSRLIQSAIAKSDATDFALFRYPHNSGFLWHAMLGSPQFVMLGEVPGDFEGKGRTPEAAVRKLIESIP